MPVIAAPTEPTHPFPGGAVTTLASPSYGSSETCVWLVELDQHAEATPHRVTREEIFHALGGEAIATIDGDGHSVRAGDTVIVPAGVDFSIGPSGGAPFRALVCFPVGGQAILGDGEPFTPPWAA